MRPCFLRGFSHSHGKPPSHSVRLPWGQVIVTSSPIQPSGRYGSGFILVSWVEGRSRFTRNFRGVVATKVGISATKSLIYFEVFSENLAFTYPAVACIFVLFNCHYKIVQLFHFLTLRPSGWLPRRERDGAGIEPAAPSER